MTDLDGMRAAGKLAAQTLDHISEFIRPGISTGELDDICHEFMTKRGAKSACLNYAPPGHTPYPKSTCISVNHVMCHGVPGDKKLADGDMLNIDVTVILDGWHGDTSRMFFVGQPSVRAQILCVAAHNAMMAGIEVIKDGITTGDIGHAIERSVAKTRFSASPDFCGHSIGQMFHGDIKVTNFGIPGQGQPIRAGDFITVEPIINEGKPTFKLLSDGWTVVTRDRKLSAQWEHTVAVLEDGFEILTLSDIS